MIIVVILLFVKPMKSSLLSRVKNRYEYIPHEDRDFVSEDLYEFPVSADDFLPEPKNIFSKLYDLNPESFEEMVTTTYDIHSFDGFRKTIENEESFEEIRKTKAYDSFTLEKQRIAEDKMDTHIGNHKTTNKGNNFLNKHIYDIVTSYQKVGSQNSIIPTFGWRPTKNISIETTLKRRKTFATLFPTRRNLNTESEATTTDRFNLKIPDWMTFLTNASDSTTTSISETLKSPDTTSFGMSQSKGSKKSKVYSCYMCGVLKSGIPRNQECYQVFDSPDFRYRWKKKRYRVKCVHNSVSYWSGRNFYGPFFRGGCFKRFLDIGTIYNERGCRVDSKWSHRGTYASQRFRKLEKLLNEVDDGCVSSPHASLIPFSRAISLYARYHVCVCKKKYCNGSEIFRLNVLFYVLVLLKF